jgi:hypothetical protein
MPNAATGLAKPFSASSPSGSNATSSSNWLSVLRLVRTLPARGLAAQSSGEIDDRAHRAVVDTPFETDGTDRGVALRDADAEREVITALAPANADLVDPIAHRQRHAQGADGGIRHEDGIVEEDHHAVTREPLQGSFVGEDELAHLGVELAEDAHDLLGLGGLGEGREATEI